MYKNEAVIISDETKETFADLCEQIDWYYHLTDNQNDYTHHKRKEDKLKWIYARSTDAAREELLAIWEEHSPVEVSDRMFTVNNPYMKNELSM